MSEPSDARREARIKAAAQILWPADNGEPSAEFCDLIGRALDAADQVEPTPRPEATLRRIAEANNGDRYWSRQDLIDEAKLALDEAAGEPLTPRDAASEIEKLTRERDEAETKLNLLLDEDLTIRDLEAKIRDGAFNLRIVSGPEGGNKVHKLVAAMLWHLLLGEDDEMPPNYRTIEFAMRPAGERDEIRCTAAVLVPGGKSPHEMRVAAESRAAAIEGALRALVAKIDRSGLTDVEWLMEALLPLRALLPESAPTTETT